MSEELLRPGLPGRSVTVITPAGRETYQVWLDVTPGGCTARIVTLPNRMWAQPGGREALKFYGATQQEAEGAAIRYIEDECVRTGRRLVSPNAPEPAIAQPLPTISTVPIRSRPAPRYPRRLLLKFGDSTPVWPAVTGNLSATGLFIITDNPAPVGSNLKIDLRFPQGPVTVGGKVVWSRERRERGRSMGIGVQLDSAPPLYINRLRTL